MQKNKKTDPAWFSQPFFFLRFIFYLFVYVCLHCVLIAVHGLSLVAGSRGHSVAGNRLLTAVASLWRGAQTPGHTGFQYLEHEGSVAMVHGLSCSEACGIL